MLRTNQAQLSGGITVTCGDSLLDEPFGALDALTRNLQEQLMKICEENQVTGHLSDSWTVLLMDESKIGQILEVPDPHGGGRAS